jgi:hypothetical protein
LLAAHALVASFLGATAVRTSGLHWLAWSALVVLALGLVVAAVLLAPWQLKFAVDARDLYHKLYEDAANEATAQTLGWLARAAFLHQTLRQENATRVDFMSRLSSLLDALMIGQTLFWIAALAVR